MTSSPGFTRRAGPRRRRAWRRWTRPPRGGVLHAAVLLQALADGFAQGHGTHGRRILSVVILNGPDTHLFDVIGSGEIGLAGAEADDVQAVGFICLNMASIAWWVEACTPMQSWTALSLKSLPCTLKSYFIICGFATFCKSLILKMQNRRLPTGRRR